MSVVPPSVGDMEAVQGAFDDLGTPLSTVTFVVVDLETTGGNPESCHITEIGAVKVVGGHVVGEFQTLVDPGEPIPPFIRLLTGITDEMVAGAPPIDEVLPAFLDFARGAVLVAHNAPFDVGFLRVAARRLELPWGAHRVVDTVPLARRLVARDEAPNHKLGTLATLFSAATPPDHRALNDARATVDVLHALLGRLGSRAATLEELIDVTTRVTPAQRRKRHLADGLPSAPGVYLFRGERDKVLYVGTSGNIARRVRSYFTAAEQRARITDMIAAATHVSTVVCATDLEARVRELRLIAEHDPPYNRRSRRPHRHPWIKLTAEPFPRLSIVHAVADDGATYCGPYAARAGAEAAIAALHDVLPLRQCHDRLARVSRRASACLLLDLGRCGGPCIGRQSWHDYQTIANRAAALLLGRSRDVLHLLADRMRALSAGERYEEAGTVRDRALALLRGAARAQRLSPLAQTPEIVAARRHPPHGWEVVSIRHGRLAGTTLTPGGADPRPFIDAMRATAEVVDAGRPPCPATHPEETDLLLRWLAADGVRLVDLVGEWSCPVGGAEGLRQAFEPVAEPPAPGRPPRPSSPASLPNPPRPARPASPSPASTRVVGPPHPAPRPRPRPPSPVGRVSPVGPLTPSEEVVARTTVAR